MTTCFGVSTVEWTIDCRRNLVGRMRFDGQLKKTYLKFGPSGENLSEFFNKLVFGLRFLVNRLGVDDTSKVIAQTVREKDQVSLFECSAPFVHEMEFWGNGWEHRDGVTESWDGVTGGCLPEDPEADPGSSILYPWGRPQPLVRAGSVDHS